MTTETYTNKAGYPVLVSILEPDDNPAFGVPLSVDLQDWLSPKAAKFVWNKGYVMPKDFFKAGVFDVMLAAVRLDNPHLDKKACIIKSNMLIEAIRLELS